MLPPEKGSIQETSIKPVASTHFITWKLSEPTASNIRNAKARRQFFCLARSTWVLSTGLVACPKNGLFMALGVEDSLLMWKVVQTMNHPWLGMMYSTYKNGDDCGMVYGIVLTTWKVSNGFDGLLMQTHCTTSAVFRGPRRFCSFFLQRAETTGSQTIWLPGQPHTIDTILFKWNVSGKHPWYLVYWMFP